MAWFNHFEGLIYVMYGCLFLVDDLKVLLSVNDNLLGRIKVSMTLGVLQISFFAIHIKIGVFMVLLSLKNFPNIFIVFLDQIPLKVFNINLLFLNKLLLEILLGLSKLKLIVPYRILLLLELFFHYIFKGFGDLDFFVFGDELFCAVAESIFVNVQTLVISYPRSSEFILANVALKRYLVAVVNKMISQLLDRHRFMELALLEYATVIYYLTVLTVGENVVQVVEVRISCLI